MDLLVHFQTSITEPMEIEDEEVISSHSLLGML